MTGGEGDERERERIGTKRKWKMTMVDLVDKSVIKIKENTINKTKLNTKSTRRVLEKVLGVVEEVIFT